MLPGAIITIQRNSFVHNDFVATEMAFRKFTLMHRRARWRRFWLKLFRLPVQIQSLKNLESTQVILESHYRGISAVSIAHIRGSENRSHDFDDRFYPLHDHSEERWLNIARAMIQEEALPPVELIKVGETYYVRDGHHRISVARALGQQAIDAVVTERIVRNKRAEEQRISKNLLDENACISVCCKKLQLQESCCGS
ncbi:hypothetical protein U27_06023 [Candidatus Vecturithrix granuli]|uniref:Uncharacterized protein n=1 Tax=Vecturithrix granuli TaxID=1499967 RepID=A0A081C392_VECG1|nr:hypothetical protein U27_06023 [Candidatus Vecturithrix granuli]